MAVLTFCCNVAACVDCEPDLSWTFSLTVSVNVEFAALLRHKCFFLLPEQTPLRLIWSQKFVLLTVASLHPATVAVTAVEQFQIPAVLLWLSWVIIPENNCRLWCQMHCYC